MKVGRFTAFNAVALAAGLAFLYAPILLVVASSFNASRLATVWGGFSLEPYRALATNEALRAAVLTSVQIALVSALAATVLGTAAAVALARHGRFRGRGAFTALLFAPMVMPEVIVGLSLLLFFVALGLDRGAWTVAAAHATMTLSFVTVVVQARLVGLDRSLEEAAADLGASPLVAFLTVTVPALAPALAAGFLLAFTLSLDDLVLASFAAGPGATTLPMFVYGQVRRGVTPEINAVATLTVLFVAIVVVAVVRLSRRRAGLSEAA